MNTKIKKRVTVCVDIEPMERLTGYLKKAGISVSHFLNEFIIQTVQGLDDLKISKDSSKMTLGEASLLIGRIAILPDKVKVKVDSLVKDAQSVLDGVLLREVKKVEKKKSR